VRRTAPRSLEAALADFTRNAAPATLLAGVQAAWGEAAGPQISEEARPLSERAGTVTLGCRSAVWVQELELMAPELTERLRAVLPSPRDAELTGLRFRVERSPRR
jgi:predicted nucleic acid-binding Zn ribbon protein